MNLKLNVLSEGDKAWMSIIYFQKKSFNIFITRLIQLVHHSNCLHLMRNEAFKNLGIDEVFCVSVNDSYVMNAWSNYMGVKNVQMIPDGTGQFTRMMGMLINKDHNGWYEVLEICSCCK